MTKNLIYLLLLYATHASARTQSESPPQVIINGGKSDIEMSRDFIAGKVIVGQQRIASSGLQNAGELLRREPAISLDKNGRIGLLGLSGYTQVLVDGMPYSGDPFSIDLIHIDKIEIIKTTSAKTGPLGIAGTINIIRKKTDRQAYKNVRLGASGPRNGLGADIAWSNNEISQNSPFSYNLSISAGKKPTSSENSYSQRSLRNDDNNVSEFSGDIVGSNVLHTLTVTTELAWAASPSYKLIFSPDAAKIRLQNESVEKRRWVDGRNYFSKQNNQQSLSGFSLPLRFEWKINSASNLFIKYSKNYSSQVLNAERVQRGLSQSGHYFTNFERKELRDDFVNADFFIDLENGHEISAGGKLVRNKQETEYLDYVDDQRDRSLSFLGQHSTSVVETKQFYIQDEWRIDRTLAINAGLSVEHRTYKFFEDVKSSKAQFAMWSPSLNLSKKIRGNNKRQLRFSLARSFQVPNVTQMLMHPVINSFAPCVVGQLCRENSIDTADLSGNSQLQPERATSLNLSYTHGVLKDSEFSVELFIRDIQDKIVNELGLDNVFWSNLPRFVYRPTNFGEANIKGVNLEGRLSSKDISKALPEVEAHGSIGWARSKLSNLPGPDNHIEGHTPWKAKFGASYDLNSFPLKVGIESSYLPGDWQRTNGSERVFQPRRLMLGANASWKINATSRLTLNLDNILQRTVSEISEYDNPSVLLQRLNGKRSYARLTVRFETKLK